MLVCFCWRLAIKKKGGLKKCREFFWHIAIDVVHYSIDMTVRNVSVSG